MYTVSFVKYFNIPREVFDKACDEFIERIGYLHERDGDDISTESYELPNADIIYTFDNEITNNYYLLATIISAIRRVLYTPPPMSTKPIRRTEKVTARRMTLTVWHERMT